jgi:hypothetical protein
VLGEDVWEELLDLVEAHPPSLAGYPEVPTPEVCEEEAEEVAELDEVDGRHYESLDLSEGLCEDLEAPDWPEGWDEETIWGDISPSKRRSLRRLLEGRDRKWVDT